MQKAELRSVSHDHVANFPKFSTKIGYLDRELCSQAMFQNGPKLEARLYMSSEPFS